MTLCCPRIVSRVPKTVESLPKLSTRDTLAIRIRIKSAFFSGSLRGSPANGVIHRRLPFCGCTLPALATLDTDMATAELIFESRLAVLGQTGCQSASKSDPLSARNIDPAGQR